MFLWRMLPAQTQVEDGSISEQRHWLLACPCPLKALAFLPCMALTNSDGVDVAELAPVHAGVQRSCASGAAQCDAGHTAFLLRVTLFFRVSLENERVLHSHPDLVIVVVVVVFVCKQSTRQGQ